jgi:hypothetical protein
MHKGKLRHQRKLTQEQLAFAWKIEFTYLGEPGLVAAPPMRDLPQA